MLYAVAEPAIPCVILAVVTMPREIYGSCRRHQCHCPNTARRLYAMPSNNKPAMLYDPMSLKALTGANLAQIRPRSGLKRGKPLFTS
ncbi:hypothetical protein LIA77_02691 [Sarocladium implicatum]|nr:hypothetical protein LIA77_02691 [Sarocladium implicatum]